MFSGIIEATATVLEAHKNGNVLQIIVSRPSHFDDVHLGDSIACNGVCLTVEKFDDKTIQFALGPETMHITGWSSENLKNSNLNLERSLQLGARIHGHLVTGHVESLATVVRSETVGGSHFLRVKLAPEALRYVWKKGSVTIHGVSLTINDLRDDELEVCLIPETIARTNLGKLKLGDRVNIETDYLAKAFLRAREVDDEQDY